MKRSKKILSIILATLMVISIISCSAFQSTAVNIFTEGDFEYAVISEGVIFVSAYLGGDTDVTLPSVVGGEAVTGIYKDCFKDSLIESVTIPDSYALIGDLAFYGCNSLTSVKLPASLETVGTMAFYGCENLATVDFSDVTQLSSLSFAMFSGCKSLTKINLPECVTALNENVFVDCESLERVTLSDEIKVIPEYAFYGCTLLGSIDLPPELTTIEQYAFYNCSSLTSVYIPVSVTSIGECAFAPMANEGGALTLDCYADTYAAEYALENNLNCTTETLIRGDADGNGAVNIRDVTYIQLYLVDRIRIDINAKTLDRIDVTGDKQITIKDATRIQLYRVNRIDSL